MQKRTNRSLIILAILIALVMASCATLPPVSQQADRERQANIWMDIYNSQVNDTKAIMTSPYSTEAQKAIGRQKKVILVQVWPLLIAYTDIVDQGGVPSDENTKAITDLINQLTKLSGDH